MTEKLKPERIFIRTEDDIHRIVGYGKLTTHFNPTNDTEYIRKDLINPSLTEAEAREIVEAHIEYHTDYGANNTKVIHEVVQAADVITLLMHHSRPQRLEEVRAEGRTNEVGG